jgi:phosphoenolpyruvate-protein kinase (PTS system EI component)
MKMKKLIGIPVSPGVSIGKAFVLRAQDFHNIPKTKIKEEQIPQEIARLSKPGRTGREPPAQSFRFSPASR